MSIFLDKQNEKIISLHELKKKQDAIICGFSKDISFKVKKRLLEIGFVSDKRVVFEQESFLGHVMLLEINGELISLRKDIAKQIQVKLRSKNERSNFNW